MLKLAIFGKKGSGKNTIANTIQEYIERNTTLRVGQFSFAEPFKRMVYDLLECPDRRFIWGSDNDKNTISHHLWENMPECPRGKKGFMTWRQILQHFGSEVFRKIDDKIWLKKCCKDINSSKFDVSIITDGRFLEAELLPLNDSGFVTIGLSRKSDVDIDTHSSEQFNIHWPFAYILDNRDSLDNTKIKTDSLVRKLLDVG